MKYKSLILIALLALGLRIYQLGSNPVILNRDEASLAYNAYLLKEVGQDEWGKNWPLTLESFGDWKLPGYPSILVLFFSFFGMSDFIVRLPSAIAGTVLVILSYFMAKTFKLKHKYAVIFSFLVAISPVFFFYSHAAWEANVALCYLIGILLLILNRSYLWHDILLFLISIVAVFTYNTPFLLMPFIIAIIPLKSGFKNYKKWLLPVIGLIIVFLTAGFIQFRISTQKSGITIFSDETVIMEYPFFRDKFPIRLKKIFANKYIYWLTIIIPNFLRSFSLKFLVQQGGSHPWHSQTGFAHFYYATYFFALLAIIKIIYDRFCSPSNKIQLTKRLNLAQKITKYLKNLKNRNYFYLFYFLMIGLAPASVTVDAPHATRSLLFFYFLLLLSVFGFKFLIVDLINSQKNKQVFSLIIAIILLIESGNYFYHFYNSFAGKQFSLKPKFDQIIQEIAIKHPDQNIAIVDEEGFHYILLAWYLKIPAQQYLDTNIRQHANKIGFKYGEQVTHYHFIAHQDDRMEDEKILLKWQNNQWIIEEF